MNEQPKTPPAFKIEPTTLYSRAALADALRGLVDLDRFLMRLRPRKVFKNCYLGADLLRALEEATPIGEDEVNPPDMTVRVRPARGGGRQTDPRRYPAGLRPIGK